MAEAAKLYLLQQSSECMAALSIYKQDVHFWRVSRFGALLAPRSQSSHRPCPRMSLEDLHATAMRRKSAIALQTRS